MKTKVQISKNKRLSKNKGITLIALVITIIVLLILAGVTINMAINSDGLFSKANDAAEGFNIKAAEEQQVVENALIKMDELVVNGSDIIRNVTKSKTYESLEEAVADSADNDVIEITGGEYTLVEDDDLLSNGPILEINKSITIRGTNVNNKPTLLLATSDGTAGNNTITNGIEIKADNVCLENLILKAVEERPSTGNLLAIPFKSSDSNDFYSGITVKNCEFFESDHSIELYGDNTTIENCVFDESGAVDQGNILYIRGTTNQLNIINNTFIGDSQKKHGISFYAGTTDANNYISGNIVIKENSFTDVYKGIVHESSKTYDGVSVEIKNNTFNNYKKKAVAIDNGTFTAYVIKDNLFYLPSEGTVIVDNGISFSVDANDNYWGVAAPNKSEIFEGNVNATSYYTADDKSTSANW